MSNILCQTKRLELFTLDPRNPDEHKMFADFAMSDDQNLFVEERGARLIDYQSKAHVGGTLKMYHRDMDDSGVFSAFVRQKGRSDMMGVFRSFRDAQLRPGLFPYVRPRYRGQGYAKEAYQAMDEILEPKGLRVTHDFTKAGNVGMARLFVSLGFKPEKIQSCAYTKSHALSPTVRGRALIHFRR